MSSLLLNTSQVAALLNLSPERVRQIARSGVLPSTGRLDGHQLWTIEEVERFAATRDQWGRFPTARATRVDKDRT